MHRIAILTVSTILVSCFQAPVGSQGTLGNRNQSKASRLLSSVLADNGVTAASIDPNSKNTQLVSVPTGSAVAGASLAVPPGALAISTQILIEEATPLATPTSLSELSIQSSVMQEGTAVSVQASESIDAKTLMTIAIPLPVGFNLATPDYSKVIVLYRVTRNDQASNVSGVIPSSQITFDNGFAKIQTLYFGAFQAVVMSEAVEAKEVKVETPAFTMSTVAAKPKIALNSASEIVAQKGRTITINGINFRSNMVLALGTTKIKNLKIESDVKASFVVPEADKGGRMALSAEQDGVLSSIPVFFLPTAEDLPIITLLPAEVCSGVKYFDRTGAMQVGVKNCSADVSGLSASDIRSGVRIGSLTGTLPTYSLCANDGEVGCVAVGPNFAAAMTTGLATKVMAGQTVGGVAGSALVRPADCAADGALNCVTTTAYPAALFAGAAAKIASGTVLAGVTGTADVRPPNCSSDGETSCVVDGTSYKAAKLSNFTSADVKSSVTIAGVTGSGTLESHSNCSSDGETSCVTGASFPAMSKSTLTANTAKIRSSLTIAGIAGTLADCASDGASDCVAVGPSYAAALLSGAAGKILSGQSLAGVAGTALGKPADCNVDGALGCVTVSSFPAADLALLSPGNIKVGAVIGGVAGAYPSSSFPLAADASPDLDAATFNVKLKASSSFGWFDRNGTRYTAAGNSNLTAANIKDGISLFGENGSFGMDCTSDGQEFCLTTSRFKAADTIAYGEWDIRAGKTVAGISGMINFYRNGASLSTFDRTIGVGAASGVDLYDSIDDYNNGGATPSLAIFGNLVAVPWVRDEASDIGGGGGTALNGVCDGSEDCVYKDQNTGLLWSANSGISTTWDDAITNCMNLTYGSFVGWRLPTQKELFQAYIDGIGFQRAGTELNLGNGGLWSATTNSSATLNAMLVSPLGASITQTAAKSGINPYVCVRP